jgi:hypothetical protein
MDDEATCELKSYPARRIVCQFLNCLGDMQMPRRAILKDKLGAQASGKTKAAKAKERPTPPATPREQQAARNGGRGRLVGVHVSEPAYKQLRIMAAEHELRHNEILREALNNWFADHGGERLA